MWTSTKIAREMWDRKVEEKKKMEGSNVNRGRAKERQTMGDDAHDLCVKNNEWVAEMNHPPADAPFAPTKLVTPTLSRVSWNGSEMFFFSRFISVVPSRLTWDGLSSWGLSRGVGMGQEEEDLPQPDPLCRHLRVSVLACLPVSCE